MRCQLDTSLMYIMNSLASRPAEQMRLHLTDEYAFVHDPITLETPTAAFLVDWGSQRKNEQLVELIGEITADGLKGLHTFIYSSKKVRLWSVGLPPPD